jgi:hypothetical protein
MKTSKKIFVAAFLLLSVIGAMKAQPGTVATNTIVTPSIDPNAPVIKLEKDTIFYGTLENKADGWRTMKVKNTGKSPLVIQNVQGTCGCTTADDKGVKTWTQEPIAPGKSGYIKVHYATERTGPFTKSVIVTSNAKTPSVTFYIKGEIKAPDPTAEFKQEAPGNGNPRVKEGGK